MDFSNFIISICSNNPDNKCYISQFVDKTKETLMDIFKQYKDGLDDSGDINYTTSKCYTTLLLCIFSNLFFSSPDFIILYNCMTNN